MRKDIERLLSEIDILEKRGRKVVRLSLLREVLYSTLDSSPEKDAELEKLHYQLTHESKLLEWQEGREVDRLQLNAAITFGGGALNIVTWMNGGAALACLSYATNIHGKALLDAMVFFSYGLLCGGLAHGGAYFAQLSYCEGKERTSNFFRLVCVILIILAYLFFLFGIQSGYDGIKEGG